MQQLQVQQGHSSLAAQDTIPIPVLIQVILIADREVHTVLPLLTVEAEALTELLLAEVIQAGEILLQIAEVTLTGEQAALLGATLIGEQAVLQEVVAQAGEVAVALLEVAEAGEEAAVVAVVAVEFLAEVVQDHLVAVEQAAVEVENNTPD